MKIQSIVLCAGMGSRLKSTKSKILHDLCGRPVGYWAVKSALLSTNLKPIVVLGHQRDSVEERLKKYFHDQVVFTEQKTPDGTGGAVKVAMPFIDPDCKSVLVVCGDTPLLREQSLKKLVTIQRKSHVPIAMFSAFSDNPYGYGRIIRDRSENICGIVEERDASPRVQEIKEINTGVYIFDAEFLRKYIDRLKIHEGRKEFYLTDLISLCFQESSFQAPVESIEIDSSEVHGINKREHLAVAQKIINQRLIRNLMDQGVTFIDPDNTYVEESVKIERDSVIYPGVHLRGETHIAEGVVVENGSVIKDSVIEKNAHILPYCVIDHAFVGNDSSVGPFARLRPDSKLESNVRVGNFVEVKRSRLREGVKAGHLAYIGDSEIGRNVNVGAGSITCNYDGKDKHRTIVRDGAFIGSNTTLIAPISVGEGAYVAGGSTIDHDVGKGELAIGRSRQTNKPDKKHLSEKVDAFYSEKNQRV